VVSLTIFGLSAAMWVRSTIFSRSDFLFHQWYRSDCPFEGFEFLKCIDGTFILDAQRWDCRRDANGLAEFRKNSKEFPAAWLYDSWHHDARYRRWGLTGISFTRYSGGSVITTSPDGEYHLIVPLWLPMVVGSIVPLCRLWGVVRRRCRRARGVCASCGYDLRATPDAGGPLLKTCSECGVAAPLPNPLPVPGRGNFALPNGAMI
jgi:hypothetical protein